MRRSKFNPYQTDGTFSVLCVLTSLPMPESEMPTCGSRYDESRCLQGQVYAGDDKACETDAGCTQEACCPDGKPW